MRSPEELRKILLRDYGTIAKMAEEFGYDWWKKQVCQPIFGPIAEDYPKQAGYIAAADHGLGCAFPVGLSDIAAGMTVVDLGCAAGIDSFIAADVVGKSGKVIGLDICPELIQKAQQIATENGISCTTFSVADLSCIPLPDAHADAMISNGVFSLLPDRKAVFAEMYRVLKPGGHFLIADLCSLSPLPEDLLPSLMQFTGCLNGIHSLDSYYHAATEAGFVELQPRSLRPVMLPESVWAKHPEAQAIFADEGPLVAAGLFGRKAD